MARKNPVPSREKAIGKRLREVREARIVSRAALARRLEITPEALASYESGRAPLPLKHGEKICRILNVNQFWLLTGKSARFGKIPFDEDTQKELTKHRLFSEAYGEIFREDQLDYWALVATVGRSVDKFDPSSVDAEREEQVSLDRAIDSLKKTAAGFPQEKRISFFRAMSLQVYRAARLFSQKYDKTHQAENQ